MAELDRVIIAFESENAARRFADTLENEGIARCVICHTSDDVKRTSEKRDINVIICGYKLRNLTAMDLMEDLPPSTAMLVVATSSQLEFIDNSDIFTLEAPVSRNDLIVSARLLLQIGHRLERMMRPTRSAEEKKIIEKAKTIIMENQHVSEEEAHRLIQKRSMDAGVKMIQTARQIIGETGIEIESGGNL